MEGRTVPEVRRPPLLIAAIVFVILIAAYLWFSGGELRESDLALLPADSVFIVVADIDALHSSDLAETVREAFGEQYTRMVDEMREQVGFEPKDIRQVLMGGNPKSESPVLIIVFEDAPDDARLAKLAASLRLGDAKSREINDHRVWSSERRRTAMAEVRADTMMIGPIEDVERAMRADDGEIGPLAELLIDEAGLDAPFAAVFDWRSAAGMPRQWRDLLPRLAKHIGPMVARMEVGDDALAQVRLLDSDGDVVLRYTLEIDGEFLGSVLAEFRPLR